MSMYNLVLGVHRQAPALLAMLEMRPDAVPRLRDAWWNGTHIVIYTRAGNGNRPDYEEMIQKMREHPGFVSDRDDDFDSTYASFYYELPDKWKHMVSSLEVETRSPNERWTESIAKLADKENPDTKRVMEALKPLADAIKSGDSDGIFEVGSDGIKKRT